MRKNKVLLGLMCLFGAITVTFTSLFIWKKVTSQTAVNYHLVNFDTDGGSFIKSQSVENGKTATKPNNPTKIIDDVVYTFDCWYKDEQEFDFANTLITNDITLKAHWLSSPLGNNHIVHLNPNGGIIDGPDILMVNDGATIPNKPNISREGYDSSKVKWYKTSDYQEGNEFIFGETKVEDDLFLHAKWESVKTYTVHFMDGSTELKTQEVDYNCHASYYKPEDDKRVFDNWYDSKELTCTFNFETKIVKDTYIYAKWNVETYTITWLDYNGDVLKIDEEVIEGSIPYYDKDPTKVPIRESDLCGDYEFANWMPAISEVHENQTYIANYDVVKKYNAQIYIKINLTEDAKVFKFYVATASSFSVDWGDGSSSTYEKSDYVMHTYEKGGEYKIRLEGDVSRIPDLNNQPLISRVYLGPKISVVPDLCFAYCTNLEFIGMSNSITSIGNSAFYNCPCLTSISIPHSVTYIAEGVIGNCPNLSTIKVDPNNTHYTSQDASGTDCDAIIEIASKTLIAGCKKTKIPNGIIRIGDWAFFGCSGLTSISIPDSVTYIGNYSFCDCSSLVPIDVPSGVISIGTYAFGGCTKFSLTKLPSKLVSVGNSAFFGCLGLTSISIPDSVTYIGEGVIGNCPNLSTIKVDPNNTHYTSQDASGTDCDAIIEIASKTLIAGCKKTKIPNGITSIADSAFNTCLGLTSITIPSSVTSIGAEAFIYCSNLVSVELSSGLTSIGVRAFYNCSSLDSISIPKNVTLIDLRTFSGCSSLRSVELPSKLISIDQLAFADCSSLTSIIFPNSLTFIGISAFAGCSKLEKVDLTAYNTTSEIPELNGSAFSGCSSNLKFCVANEEMANKFMNSEKGWPTTLESYNWPQ